MSTTPHDNELRFYYFGLYAVLKRYRASTILGWLVVMIGCIGLALGWRVTSGILGVVLSVSTIVAGLALVSNAVAFLESYVRISFPMSSEEKDRSGFMGEIALVMKDIEAGGWQEAYAAMAKLEVLRVKYSLPPL